MTLSCKCLSSCAGSLLDLNGEFELLPNSWSLQPGLHLAALVLMNHNTGLHQSDVVQGQTWKAFQVKLMCRESKAAKTPFIFFFNYPPYTAWTPFITGLVLKTDLVKCYDKLKNGSLSSKLYCVMNGHHDVAQPLASAAFFTTFGVHSVSLSFSPLSLSRALFFEITCLALCPAATCHQRASQPQAHTADPRQMSQSGHWGGGGTGAELAEWHNRQKEKEPKKKVWKKPLALAIMFGLT